MKKIEHGKLPHQCKLDRADVAHLAKALNEEGLCRTQVVPAGMSPSNVPQTALVMELGRDMGPRGDVPMPVRQRRDCLLAMARCARWLSTHNLGYVDFKLENLVEVAGVPRYGTRLECKRSLPPFPSPVPIARVGP